MRHLTLVVFLTLIMGFAGCGDMADTGGEADAGDGAMEETTMDEGAAMEGDTAMDEGSSDTPQWQMLDDTVVHPE